MLPTTQVPVGTIIASVLQINSMPPDWLLCDGNQVPQQYQTLASLVPNGMTPALACRVLLGSGKPVAGSQTDGLTSNFPTGVTYSVGNTGGECAHQLVTNELAKHSHIINGGNFGIHNQSFQGFDHGNDQPFETNATGWNLVGTDATGGDIAHNTMQPYYVVNYYIYAGPPLPPGAIPTSA